MTNRLELNWKLDGFVDEQRYYCSETPIDVNHLPTPKAVLSTEARSYIDTNIEIGKTYYIRVGSVKNEVEKLSDEHIAIAGVLWTPLKLSTLINFVADNIIADNYNRVSQITDVSGNNRNAVQSIDAKKPTLTNISASQKALQLDGVDDFLWISDTSYLKDKKAVWVFTVCEPDLKTSYSSIFYSIYSQNGSSRLNFSLNSGKLAFGGRRTVSGGYLEVSSQSSVANEINISFGQHDYENKTGVLFNNGSQVGLNNNLGTAGVSDSSGLFGGSIGALVTSSLGASFSESYVGKIGCVIVGDGVLSLSDRQKLEGWAAHKYGLTDSLPLDHPYKTLIPTV
ncbi:hypothetical protein [Acinetobacter sp. CFCC 10889]|uniref:hypothetical protein n=1 Tax=Acinetobacter sp. CFCC 10889 TaxID=1775557 RepID=UPI001BC8743B|nr:hypothetical protein [Acinetobacter sp. CFCC 10889]